MDCLGKIEQASGHLLKLINEVLNMSKIESGRMELIEKPILIHSVVDNVLMLLQDNIEKKEDDAAGGYGPSAERVGLRGRDQDSGDFVKSGVERRQIYAGGTGQSVFSRKSGRRSEATRYIGLWCRITESV